MKKLIFPLLIVMVVGLVLYRINTDQPEDLPPGYCLQTNQLGQFRYVAPFPDTVGMSHDTRRGAIKEARQYVEQADQMARGATWNEVPVMTPVVSSQMVVTPDQIKSSLTQPMRDVLIMGMKVGFVIPYLGGSVSDLDYLIQYTSTSTLNAAAAEMDRWSAGRTVGQIPTP